LAAAINRIVPHHAPRSFEAGALPIRRGWLGDALNRRVEQDISGVELSNLDSDEDPVSGEQYRAFHNFFHAVRIWRARMLSLVVLDVTEDK
jgi:hypothetical protein